LQVPAGVDVVADVGIVGVEGAAGSVSEPVRVIEIAGFVLAELHFPKSGMEVGVDGIEGGLGGHVGTREALVMKILIFVKDNLGDWFEEIGIFQTGKTDGVVPDHKAIAIGGKAGGRDDSVSGRIESVAWTPKDVRIAGSLGTPPYISVNCTVAGASVPGWFGCAP
jgi:hypothetical protein